MRPARGSKTGVPHGSVLIGADGLWSKTRTLVVHFEMFVLWFMRMRTTGLALLGRWICG